MERLQVILCLWLLILNHSIFGGESISPTGGKWTDPHFSIEMILISSGTFVMGSSDTESDRNVDEGPQHQVTITNDFYLGKYEVTQGQWEAVINKTNSWPGKAPTTVFGQSARHPAYFISWDDINRVGGFLDKLNAASGCDISKLSTDSARYHPTDVPSGCYRLPTEAEWEYAARAGSTTRFSFGEDSDYTILRHYAWYFEHSNNQADNYPDYGTIKVGKKLANPWDLHDMHGNVWEWTYDRYGAYHSSSQIDPYGPHRGFRRVLRGGGWRIDPRYLRSADRAFNYPGYQHDLYGFRLLLVK